MANQVDSLDVDRPEVIREGLPIETFEELARFLKMPLTPAADLVGIAPRTLKRRIEEGHFKPEESDRIARVIRLTRLALDAFDADHEAALAWLKSPHALLQDETPLEHLDTEIGARSVEDLLNAIRYGFPV